MSAIDNLTGRVIGAAVIGLPDLMDEVFGNSSNATAAFGVEATFISSTRSREGAKNLHISVTPTLSRSSVLFDPSSEGKKHLTRRREEREGGNEPFDGTYGP